MTIRKEAGKLRGVRVMEDPQGILLDSFLDSSGVTRYGYLLFPFEGDPAVYDGAEWHPIYDGDITTINEIATEQRSAISKAAEAGAVEYQKMFSMLLTNA